MNSRQISLILFFIIVHLFSFGCNKELTPISASGQSFEISCGTITKIDNYPLYTMNYATDYYFDEYLQTGDFPLISSINFSTKKFSCTCFTSFAEGNQVMGRNYDWSQKSTYLLLFSNPTDAYSSVSMVDLNFLGYKNNKPPNHADNKRPILISPYYPFDGMNEKGVAIGMNALP